MSDKVVVYVVNGDKLLVFRHIDFTYEQVGIQVPAGSIKPGEEPKAAALRELQEETGREGYKIVSFLGTSEYDKSPLKPEIHKRYFFLANPTEDLPERWVSQENHDGLEPPTRFECFWIPVKYGHVLEAGLGALLGKIEG